MRPRWVDLECDVFAAQFPPPQENVVRAFTAGAEAVLRRMAQVRGRDLAQSIGGDYGEGREEFYREVLALTPKEEKDSPHRDQLITRRQARAQGIRLALKELRDIDFATFQSSIPGALVTRIENRLKKDLDGE